MNMVAAFILPARSVGRWRAEGVTEGRAFGVTCAPSTTALRNCYGLRSPSPKLRFREDFDA